MKEKVRKLAGEVGEFLELEDLDYARGFIRVRIMVNTKNPLVAGCWLPRKGDRGTWIEFLYKRLQDFCYKCGRIGHVNTECFFRPNRGGAAGYREWTKAKTIRDIQENPRPVVMYQGEIRYVGTNRERRRPTQQVAEGYTRWSEGDNGSSGIWGPIQEQESQIRLQDTNWESRNVSICVVHAEEEREPHQMILNSEFPYGPHQMIMGSAYATSHVWQVFGL